MLANGGGESGTDESDKGGERTCACVVRAISSALAPYSSASTPSAIISPALGPICALSNTTRSQTITRTYDVHSKYTVRLLLDEELDLTLGVQVGLGARVS